MFDKWRYRGRVIYLKANSWNVFWIFAIYLKLYHEDWRDLIVDVYIHKDVQADFDNLILLGMRYRDKTSKI